jgi:hypothetical protein
MSIVSSSSSTLLVAEDEHPIFDRSSSSRPSSTPTPYAIMYEEETITAINEKSTPNAKPTPLPRLQVSILLLMLLSEPCTAAVLLPFINNLVYEVGITHGDKAKVGYYAGMIVSFTPKRKQKLGRLISPGRNHFSSSQSRCSSCSMVGFLIV